MLNPKPATRDSSGEIGHGSAGCGRGAGAYDYCFCAAGGFVAVAFVAGCFDAGAPPRRS